MTCVRLYDPPTLAVTLANTATALTPGGRHSRLGPAMPRSSQHLHEHCALLTALRIDSDHVASTHLFQHDSSQQAVAAAEVDAPALRHAVLNDLRDLNRAPQSGCWLERVYLKKPDEQVPSHSNCSSCSS